VVIGLVSNWNYAQRTPGVDYYVAWAAAHATRTGGNYQIYEREDQLRLGEDYRENALVEGSKSRRAAFARVPMFWPTGTPFLYAAVNALSASSYQTSLTIWNALSLIGFSMAILLFCKLLGVSKTATLVIFLACLTWMNAFHSDIRVANVNCIQLGLLAAVYYLLTRDAITICLAAAGFLVAMLAFLKPNLAPVSLLLLGAWLIRGQQRKFLVGFSGMVLGALFSVGTASLFFGGVDIWFEWLDELRELTRYTLPADSGNFDVLQILHLPMEARGQTAAALAACALTLGFLWWGRRSNQPGPEREHIEYAQMIGMGCLVHMLTSSLVWLHYFLLALPMIIVAFRPWTGAPQRAGLEVVLFRLIPTLILLAFLDGPHWTLFYDDAYAIHAIPSIVSIAVLFLLGLWQLRFRGGPA